MKYTLLSINPFFHGLVAIFSVIVIMIAIIESPHTVTLTTNIVQASQGPEFYFENSTHYQLNPNGSIHVKPFAFIVIQLVKDPEGYAFDGELYKPSDKDVQFSFNDEGKFKTYYYNLTNSGVNEVIISDTRTEATITYKMPLGINTTIESVQQIHLNFDVETIERLTDGVTYVSGTDSPMIINNTAYLFPWAIVDQYDDGTASISISGDNPPVRNDPELISNILQLFD